MAFAFLSAESLKSAYTCGSVTWTLLSSLSELHSELVVGTGVLVKLFSGVLVKLISGLDGAGLDVMLELSRLGKETKSKLDLNVISLNERDLIFILWAADGVNTSASGQSGLVEQD